MTNTNTVPAGVIAHIGQLGQEDRQATEVLGRTIPPKLAAALIMAEEAQDGRINVGHMDALMGAYYGNQLPASLPQQKSKFQQFVLAGTKGLPVVQAIHRAAEMIDTAKTVAADLPDAKQRAKEVKAAEKMGAGIFEKATNIVRAQAKKGKERLTDQEIRDLIAPTKAESEDAFGDDLAALLAKAEAMAKSHGNFAGYAEIVASIGAASAAHERSKSAPLTPMPQATVASPNNSQSNVVVMPAPVAASPSPAVVEADSELDAILAVG